MNYLKPIFKLSTLFFVFLTLFSSAFAPTAPSSTCDTSLVNASSTNGGCGIDTDSGTYTMIVDLGVTACSSGDEVSITNNGNNNQIIGNGKTLTTNGDCIAGYYESSGVTGTTFDGFYIAGGADYGALFDGGGEIAIGVSHLIAEDVTKAVAKLDFSGAAAGDLTDNLTIGSGGITTWGAGSTPYALEIQVGDTIVSFEGSSDIATLLEGTENDMYFGAGDSDPFFSLNKSETHSSIDSAPARLVVNIGAGNCASTTCRYATGYFTGYGAFLAAAHDCEGIECTRVSCDDGSGLLTCDYLSFDSGGGGESSLPEFPPYAIVLIVAIAMIAMFVLKTQKRRA